MKSYDISDEEYRHYTVYSLNGVVHGVHITNPQELFWEPEHHFHRIWDGKIVHLAPAPGPLIKNNEIVGWVDMVWCPRDKNKPCAF